MIHILFFAEMKLIIAGGLREAPAEQAMVVLLTRIPKEEMGCLLFTSFLCRRWDTSFCAVGAGK
jgi:hypothetical protein